MVNKLINVIYKSKAPKIAIFCDSEFWHGYDWDHRKYDIKSNQEFWINKIENNIIRDQKVNTILKSEGWCVLRFWGKDIKNNLAKCADIIERKVEEKRKCLTEQ